MRRRKSLKNKEEKSTTTKFPFQFGEKGKTFCFKTD